MNSLLICGLLGILVMAVSAKPTIESYMDDIAMTAPTNEILNSMNDEHTLITTIAEVEVTTSHSVASTTTDSTSNTDTSAISMETIMDSITIKSTALDTEPIQTHYITPAMGVITESFDKSTIPSLVDINIPTTNVAPDVTNFNSLMSDENGSGINPTIDDNGSGTALTAGTTILVSLEPVTMEVPTMFSMVTDIKINDVTEAKIDDMIQATSSNIDISKSTDSQAVSLSVTTGDVITERTTIGIINLPIEAIFTSTNENSIGVSHDEVDNLLLSLSSNEDTTRVESLTNLPMEAISTSTNENLIGASHSEADNVLLTLSSLSNFQNSDDKKEILEMTATDPPRLQESKNDVDEKAKGNSNSVVVSFVALFSSMALLHVIY